MSKFIAALLTITPFQGLILCSYFFFFLVFPITKSISYIGLFLPISLYLVIKIKNNSLLNIYNSVIKNPLTYIFFYIVLLNLISNVAFVKAQVEFKLLSYILLMYATRYFLVNKLITPKIIIIFFSLSAIVLIIDGYWQFWTGYDFFLNRTIVQNHIRSAMEHHNSFGLILISFLMILTFAFFEKSKSIYIKLLIFLFGIIVFYVLLLTGSRSSWLSIAVFWIILLFFKRKELNWYLFVPIVLSFSIIFIWIISKNSFIFQRFKMMLEGNSSGRDQIWLYFLNRVPDKLFFGHGLTSPHYLEIYQDNFLYPHNLIIEIIYSFGIIGFICFCAIVWKLSRKIFTSNNIAMKPYLIASFATLIGVQQQLETSMLIHKVAGPLLFLYLALINYLSTINNQNINKKGV